MSSHVSWSKRFCRTATTFPALGLMFLATIGCSSQKEAAQAPERKDPNLKKFVNSRAALANVKSSSAEILRELREHYVDFSFDFPASWELLPHGVKGNQNFVQVKRALSGEKPYDEYPLEDFAVGHFAFKGRPEDAEARLPENARMLMEQLAAGLPNYQKKSQGPTVIGRYRGFHVLFAARVNKTPKGPITIWGRMVLLLPESGSRGVLLSLIATSLAPEFTSENDIGHKGELPIILNSFKLGR